MNKLQHLQKNKLAQLGVLRERPEGAKETKNTKDVVFADCAPLKPRLADIAKSVSSNVYWDTETMVDWIRMPVEDFVNALIKADRRNGS